MTVEVKHPKSQKIKPVRGTRKICSKTFRGPSLVLPSDESSLVAVGLPWAQPFLNPSLISRLGAWSLRHKKRRIQILSQNSSMTQLFRAPPDATNEQAKESCVHRRHALNTDILLHAYGGADPQHPSPMVIAFARMMIIITWVAQAEICQIKAQKHVSGASSSLRACRNQAVSASLLPHSQEE